MKMTFHADADGVTLTPERGGRLDRLLGRTPDLTAADPGSHAVALALGDLASYEEDHPGEVEIAADRIRLSHVAVASLDGSAARALGLPPLPDLTFSTDVRGVVGSEGFSLTYRWLRDGRPEPVRRTGAILHTGSGDRRIPAAILGAIELAESPYGRDLPSQWNTLARFRSALTGGDTVAGGRIAMTEFLADLDVHLASGFSMVPKTGHDGLDFDVNAHAGRGPEADAVAVDQDEVAARVRERGALPAYRLGRGSFLVVDEAARPVLDVMARMQRAPAAEREAFVRNPLPLITQEVEKRLVATGALDDLGDADRQEKIEAASASFIELPGYADRVAGIGTYERPDLDIGPGSGMQWMPEIFGARLAEHVGGMDVGALEGLKAEIQSVLSTGLSEIEIDGTRVSVDGSAIAALDAEIERRRVSEESNEGESSSNEADHASESGPQILQPGENFDRIEFEARFVPRHASKGHGAAPEGLRTPLHPHQTEGLSWAQSAWRAGLPGILNADEQGLGKTLQTIAFLAWLKERLAEEDGPCRGPVLVVAPTSLLENWEAEVSRHLEAPGLGTLVRLFGSGTAAFRKAGARGRDTDDATDRLDFTVIHEAMAEGRAHRMWMLTTYQTLTNYQHSLGRIPFSAIVFDEIQALKNPGTLAAKAAKAMNGDFRIGLTGTPVENNITDLWAVMDQLAPGYLGPLNEFRSRFRAEDPDPDLLGELHNLVFAPQGNRPAFALRRLKEDAAAHLPEKARFLHPARMPPVQAEAYESARAALAGGGLGAALKMLQRIRGVSLHPDPGMEDGFESASARLSGALKILDRVRDVGERALVFIEDRRMQHRFVALARARYGLNRIDIINGNTPIRQRQAIVDRFQELRGTRTFSFLVLGPRAAGTGLTLTAATNVIHLSRWWNPAVEEQCNDRVHRIGQDRPVSIHMPMSVHPRYGTGSFDCQLQILMERKRLLARQTLFPAGETKGDADQIRRGLVRDGSGPGDIDEVIAELFTAMKRDRPRPLPDGSYPM